MRGENTSQMEVLEMAGTELERWGERLRDGCER